MIGSSNGGFAAIKIASFFNNSTCIALCPQLSIPLYLKNRFSEFEKSLKTKFNITDERLYAINEFNNQSVNYLIFSNIASKSDKEQIEYLFNKFSKKYSIGFNLLQSNIGVILYDIDSTNEVSHLVQPDFYEILFLLEIVQKQGLTSKSIGNITKMVIDALYYRYTNDIYIYITHKKIRF